MLNQVLPNFTKAVTPVNSFWQQKLQDHAYRTKILSQAVNIELNIFICNEIDSSYQGLIDQEKIAIQEADLEFQKDPLYSSDRKYVLAKMKPLVSELKSAHLIEFSPIFLKKTHNFISKDEALVYDKIGLGFSDLVFYMKGSNYYIILPTEVESLVAENYDTSLMYKLPENIS